MPRRSILSAAERESLLALPDTKDDLIRHYTYGLLPGVLLGGRVLTVSGGGDDGDGTGSGLLAGQDRVQPEADAPGPASGPVVDDITFSSAG